ncbi:hypothetical protein FQV39_06265 [Bosea sp. F3-2]|uniref:hypothetical protein n=1 Tax=Bosea sp. F3-2 TaxID=2599640 RepID=UPI0011ECA25D|nr:hypothetical protein [Bosea sp. F3-2]QEL22212.1 hypothetical protein FQV39_06265 [Bosea sp. F3-2]
MQAKLRDGVAKTKPGDWVRTQQFDASITRDAKIPTLTELDAIAPNHIGKPVVGRSVMRVLLSN